MLQPVSEYADTSQWIRQRVWVETNFDSDRDGKPDRIHVDLVRPGAAEKAGVKLPDHHARVAVHRAWQSDVNNNVETELGAPPPGAHAPK